MAARPPTVYIHLEDIKSAAHFAEAAQNGIDGLEHPGKVSRAHPHR